MAVHSSIASPNVDINVAPIIIITNKSVMNILEHIFFWSWYLRRILLSIIVYNSRWSGAIYAVKQIMLIRKREFSH